MESFSFETKGNQILNQRSHVGVVGSGDLEVLIEPGNNNKAIFNVRTASEGFQETWKAVFERFMDINEVVATITINDFGATPGVVALRLAQALEIAKQNKD